MPIYTYSYIYSSNIYTYLYYVGERYMTMNVHNLLHLPSVVRQLGPLWVNSCFGFETAIGELLSLFHGSQGIEDQVRIYVYVAIYYSLYTPVVIASYIYVHIAR